MYKFLFDKDHNEKYLQAGLSFAETTQVLSKDNVSCLYILRNLHECLKQITNAQDINIKLNGKGDSNDVAEIYDSYIKKHKN